LRGHIESTARRHFKLIVVPNFFRYRIDNHIEEIHIEQSIIYHIEETAARHRKACGVKGIFNVVLLVFFFPHIQDALRTALSALASEPFLSHLRRG